jgi:predicted RNA-binding Zn-ribbon protein involved in translation (DUF1610 family)
MTGFTFVCSQCNEDAEETVLRTCPRCKRAAIVGYRCDNCGHEDIDPAGQEWGHGEGFCAPAEIATHLPDTTPGETPA